MRYGFTTGSCAAAAAKAAAYMLLFRTKKESVEIKTPKGAVYRPEIIEIKRTENEVSCAVIKDGGDDPDATSGARIRASVSIKKIYNDAQSKTDVLIEGGEGIGRVTKPGLDQAVGNAAINHVPREMIKAGIMEVCEAADFCGVISVIISCPEGEAIAARTFNPRLGILGGISIIGTSGVVEPMSMKAIVDTIRVELRQRKEMGDICARVSPGNYGAAYMKERYGYDNDKSVKCSNFIGETIDMAIQTGFENMLLTGNIGKLVKVAGGIMNTHSREADCRMEILAASALKAGAPAGDVLKILNCVVTDEALMILKENGFLKAAMDILMEKIMYYLKKRAADKIEIECIVYSSKFGELGKSEGADKWLTLLARDQERRI